MKTLILFLIFLSTLLVPTNKTYACSCARITLCESMEKAAVDRIFLGEVLGSRVYKTTGNLEHHVLYLKVLKYYKNTASEPYTDTLKIYGLSVESGCEMNLRDGYLPGDRLIWINDGEFDNNQQILQPDTLQEAYTEIQSFLCMTRRLLVTNNTVRGIIKDGIGTYPFDLFESNIENCSFSQEELDGIDCGEKDIRLVPNPNAGEPIFIRRPSVYYSVDKIALYNSLGQLVYTFKENDNSRISDLIHKKGVYYLQCRCNSNIFLKKLIVQ